MSLLYKLSRSFSGFPQAAEWNVVYWVKFDVLNGIHLTLNLSKSPYVNLSASSQTEW